MNKTQECIHLALTVLFIFNIMFLLHNMKEYEVISDRRSELMSIASDVAKIHTELLKKQGYSLDNQYPAIGTR